MSNKSDPRIVTRSGDKRISDQLSEIIRASIEDTEVPRHRRSHAAGGIDRVYPGDIGAETPQGAQQKINNTLQDYYTQDEVDAIIEEETRNGGPTAERPSEPRDYQMYFDTDLGLPIWYDGTDWVNAEGIIV